MSKILKILAINPGSTSTKIAVFENETEKFRKNIEHSNTELAKYASVADQYDMRKNAVLSFLKEINFDITELSAIVARGGSLPPLKGGAYRINDIMVDQLRNHPTSEHASNVAAIIAYDFASNLHIPAFIYDALSVDEFEEIARISGMPSLNRDSLCHTLNMKAVARKVAASLGKPYQDLNLIVAHLGGGITISVHSKGRMIDIVSDDEGPFSPERAGRVPCRRLIEQCYSGQYEHLQMRKMLRGNGGLIAYLGTNNALEVEARIQQKDHQALLVYQAMAYQIAKGIGELSTVLHGQIDQIALTGGLAHSAMLTDWISDRVKFIAPVQIVPGENELESLALGALRVLRQEENAHTFG